MRIKATTGTVLIVPANTTDVMIKTEKLEYDEDFFKGHRVKLVQ